MEHYGRVLKSRFAVARLERCNCVGAGTGEYDYWIVRRGDRIHTYATIVRRGAKWQAVVLM